MSPWSTSWPPLPVPHGSLRPTFSVVEQSTPIHSPQSSIVVSVLSDTISTHSSISIVSASDVQESFGFAHIGADDGDETLDLSFLDEANLTCSDIDRERKLETSKGESLSMDSSFHLSFLEEANLTCSDIDQERKLGTSERESLSMACSFDMVTTHMV